MRSYCLTIGLLVGFRSTIQGNAQKAAMVRKQIAGELWPQGTKVLSKMHQALTELSNTIQEIDQLNSAMGALTVEHEKLIGETIPVPMMSSLVPRDLRHAANIRLPELPESLELKVYSQQMREAQERPQTPRQINNPCRIIRLLQQSHSSISRDG